jgi:hypothetical protein
MGDDYVKNWMVCYTGYENVNLLDDLCAGCEIFESIEIMKGDDLSYLYKDNEGYAWDILDGYTHEFKKSYLHEDLPFVLKAILEQCKEDNVNRYWVMFRR